jgi:hypothetical protein
LLSSAEFLELTDPRAEVFTFKDARSRGVCSASQVCELYALLFHREPEPDKLKDYANKADVDLLVEGILRSSEYRTLSRQFDA